MLVGGSEKRIGFILLFVLIGKIVLVFILGDQVIARIQLGVLIEKIINLFR